MGANPFTPNFGQIPRVLAGRDMLLDEMRNAFENAPGDPSLTSILVGARGTGKTSLLSQLANDAQGQGWVVVNVPCIDGMLENIVQGAANAAAHLIDAENGARLTGISLGQMIGLEWESADSVQPTWYARLSSLLDKLGNAGVGLLITVDEVRPSLSEMIELASYYQLCIREDRKIALLMAGLPAEVSSLLNDGSVSFLRRASQYHLGQIPDSDISLALQKTAASAEKGFTDEALCAAVAVSDGFPFMMQLVGYRSWQAAGEQPEITVAHVEIGIERAKADMRTRVLDSTLNELSEGDIRFLTAMLPDALESSTGKIAKRMGRTDSYASQYRRRLIERGIIEPASRGKVRFALPLLQEYLPEYLGIEE